MDRRFFLQSLLGATGAVALRARAAPADPYQAAFEAARAGHPWTLGFEGLQADVPPLALQLEGRLPAALQGSFYRNGPARHQIGGQRYHHWFDGDGMLQRYRIDARGVVHQGRFVRTEKFVADSAAGRIQRAAFGTNGAEPPASPDSMNAANTSVVQHGGALMVLWEGGSATRIDPQTLDSRGLETWRPDYAGMPFSAHPRIAPDGTLWNFGVSSGRSLLTVYKVARDGRLDQVVTQPIPQLAMVHDFAITERHLVFLLPPLIYDLERAKAGATFAGSHVWRPELGLRVLVLPQDRLDQPIWFELPAGFVFHLGNAWEETGAGRIRLDCVRADNAWHAVHGLGEMMQGRYRPHDFPVTTLIELDLRTRRARQQALGFATEFPRIDPRVVGRRYGQLYSVARIDAVDRPGYDAVMRLDLAGGRIDRWRYGADVMVEEHVFVPDPHGKGGETDGWLVGTALDLQRRAMLLSVFDAGRLAEGPIAQARMPRVMPLGLHAIFVPA